MRAEVGYQLQVQHGTLINVYGTPVRSGGYLFMPADVELDGNSSSLNHRLEDQCDDRAHPALLGPVRRGFDAAWVRARIPRLFGFTPEPAEGEKALIDVGFVAVAEAGMVCYPFLCADHHGRSALGFSDEGPTRDIQRSIAIAFWTALAGEPEELADFERRVYHPGAGVWLDYGCESGRVYCDESED